MNQFTFKWEQIGGGTLFDSEGSPCAIALDRSSGNPRPRIVASEGAMLPHRYRLHVRDRESGCWRAHLLKWPARQFGADLALAVDSKGRSHVAFIERVDSANGNLYYFVHDGEWLVERTRLNTENPNPHYVAMVLDERDRAEILFYAGSPSRDLKFFRRTGSDWDRWETGTVDSVGWTGYAVSMVRDPGGRQHAAYHSARNFSLRYASREPGGEWEVGDKAVDEKHPGDPGSQATGYYPSIATDASGRPFIAFTTNGNASRPETGDVRLAWRDAEKEWKVVTVAEDVPRASAVSLVIRETGAAPVATILFQDTKHNLILAHSRDGEYKEWEFQSILEDSPEMRSFPSMIFDLDSAELHIAAGRRIEFFHTRLLHGVGRLSGDAERVPGDQDQPSPRHELPVRDVDGNWVEDDLPENLGDEDWLPEGEYLWPGTNAE